MISAKTQLVIAKIHKIDGQSAKIKTATQTVGAFLPTLAILLIRGMGMIDTLYVVAMSGSFTFLYMTGMINFTAFLLLHHFLSNSTLTLLAFSVTLIINTRYIASLKIIIGGIYDRVKLEQIGNFVCIVLEKAKQKLFRDLPEINNVSILDLNKLVNALHAFAANPGFTVTNANDHQAFIDHLTKTEQTHLLLILYRIGADKADCVVEKIENQAAIALGTPGRNSLTWLCAKALSPSRTASVPDRALELVNATRPFVRSPL